MVTLYLFLDIQIFNTAQLYNISDPDFNPKEAKKMEEELKKMEKKNEKKTFRGTAKAVGLASKLSPKSQRKKDKLLTSTAQLRVRI